MTGASQGIGKAIAIALSTDGATVTLAGRSSRRLREVQQQLSGPSEIMSLDLSDMANIEKFAKDFADRQAELDALVNCGGIYRRGNWQETSVDDFDELYQTNVRGTYALTKALLPSLTKSNGDVVFMNSSIVDSSAANVGGYAATKHALRGIADALRDEVNELGVRVLSIYPGRTATPGQKEIHDTESKVYRPEILLQPSDIAEMVVACLSLPATAEVTDVHIRPRHKSP